MALNNATPYKILPYTIDNFLSLLVNEHTSLEEIKKKCHGNFFRDYFGKTDPKTIVAESEYIDHDYLEDFANYYVKCFTRYKRKCIRLHLFGISFDEEAFDKALSGELNDLLDALQEKNIYLGFVVVKPLPKTVIGRTCLRPIQLDDNDHFPVNRTYEAHLFGINLKVETLAFQEQDQVAAACATNAIWTTFQRTALLYHHHIPSPIEITKSSSLTVIGQKRILPNSGLTSEQMAYAIRYVGLDPVPINIDDAEYYEHTLLNITYAYLKLGIPVLLGLELHDLSKTSDLRLGLHSVSVTGYRLGNKSPKPLKEEIDPLTTASRITEFYVHDDQVGPFAIMQNDGKKEPKTVRFSLSTLWIGENGTVGPVRAVPTLFVLPLYHKIRINFDPIDMYVSVLDAIIEEYKQQGFLKEFLSSRLEWDIYLSSSNDLKKEIIVSDKLGSSHRKELLTSDMPRFVWCAKAISLFDNNPKIEFIFDATEVEQGNLLVAVIKYDSIFYDYLKLLIRDTNPSKLLKKYNYSILKWI